MLGSPAASQGPPSGSAKAGTPRGRELQLLVDYGSGNAPGGTPTSPSFPLLSQLQQALQTTKLKAKSLQGGQCGPGVHESVGPSLPMSLTGLPISTGPSALLAPQTLALIKSLTLSRKLLAFVPSRIFHHVSCFTGPWDFPLLSPSLAPFLHLPFALVSLLGFPASSFLTPPVPQMQQTIPTPYDVDIAPESELPKNMRPFGSHIPGK